MRATIHNGRTGKDGAYNTKHKITPTAIVKSIENSLVKNKLDPYVIETAPTLKAAEKETEYFSKPQLEKRIRTKRKEMETAAKDLDFMSAARLRDEIKMLQDKTKALA